MKKAAPAAIAPITRIIRKNVKTFEEDPLEGGEAGIGCWVGGVAGGSGGVSGWEGVCKYSLSGGEVGGGGVEVVEYGGVDGISGATGSVK